MAPLAGSHRINPVQLEGQMGVGLDTVKPAPAVPFAVSKVRLEPLVGAREAGQPVSFFFLPKLRPRNATGACQKVKNWWEGVRLLAVGLGGR